MAHFRIRYLLVFMFLLACAPFISVAESISKAELDSIIPTNQISLTAFESSIPNHRQSPSSSTAQFNTIAFGIGFSF
jgi:hypothetical protein